MKNKIIGISLILCLVVPVAATYTWYRIQKKQIRHEVKHLLMANTNKKDLVLLAFSKNEPNSQLNWKHSKEFEFQKNLYDVVESRTTQDSIYYWCWPDKKETQLNKNLAEVVNKIFGNQPETNKKQHRFKQFYQTLFFAESSSSKTDIIFVLHHAHSYINLYKTIVLPITSPPPQQAA